MFDPFTANTCTKTVVNLRDSRYREEKKMLWDAKTVNNKFGSLRSTYLEQQPRFSEIYLPWTTTPALWVLFTLKNYPSSLRSTYLEQTRLSAIYLPRATTQVLWALRTLNNPNPWDLDFPRSNTFHCALHKQMPSATTERHIHITFHFSSYSKMTSSGRRWWPDTGNCQKIFQSRSNLTVHAKNSSIKQFVFWALLIRKNCTPLWCLKVL